MTRGNEGEDRTPETLPEGIESLELRYKREAFNSTELIPNNFKFDLTSRCEVSKHELHAGSPVEASSLENDEFADELNGNPEDHAKPVGWSAVAQTNMEDFSENASLQLKKVMKRGGVVKSFRRSFRPLKRALQRFLLRITWGMMFCISVWSGLCPPAC